MKNNLRMVLNIIKREKLELSFALAVSIFMSAILENIYIFGAVLFPLVLLLWARLCVYYETTNIWHWVKIFDGYIFESDIPLVKTETEDWCKDNCRDAWNMKLARTGKDFLIKNRIRNDRYVDQVFFSSKSDLALFLLFEVDIQRAQTKVTRPAAPTIVWSFICIGSNRTLGSGDQKGQHWRFL
jgi:hypothetical protein